MDVLFYFSVVTLGAAVVVDSSVLPVENPVLET